MTVPTPKCRLTAPSPSLLPGLHPQARISHLTVYGASYYSYVYARMLSAAVWNQHLEGRPMDREAGELQ